MTTEVDLQAEVEHLRYLLDEMTTPPPEWAGLVAKWGLSPCQAVFLSVLLRAKGQVVTREKLLSAAIWATKRQDDGPEIKIVDVTICKLRQALRRHGDPFEIRTVYGAGYVIEGQS